LAVPAPQRLGPAEDGREAVVAACLPVICSHTAAEGDIRR
jgi:hypothetical protein